MTESPIQSSTCPICGGTAREYCRKRALDVDWIVDCCDRCGHGFVRNRPTADQLAEIYAGEDHHPLSPLTLESLRTKRDAIDLAGQVARVASTRGRALDVGCGDGAFAWHLHGHGFKPIVLIDLDERARAAESLVPDSEFRRIPFESVDDGPYSAIIMSQTLEHALDPVGWLTRARTLLSPTGILAIALPNFGGVYRLLGTRDPMIIPPVHLNYFTDRSLCQALERTGFRVLRRQSSSRIRVTGDHGALSPSRAAVGHLWNAVSRVLNPTTRGIFLNIYAQPADQSSSD
jgi:SAM-dependent methyltransferase